MLSNACRHGNKLLQHFHSTTRGMPCLVSSWGTTCSINLRILSTMSDGINKNNTLSTDKNYTLLSYHTINKKHFRSLSTRSESTNKNKLEREILLRRKSSLISSNHYKFLSTGNEGSKNENNKQNSPKSEAENRYEAEKEAWRPGSGSSSQHGGKEGQKSSSEKHEMSFTEWIKEHNKNEVSYGQQYRRTEYDNPIQRAVGIFTDDIKIFFYNIYFIIREVYGSIKGLPPLEHKYEKRYWRPEDEKQQSQEQSDSTSQKQENSLHSEDYQGSIYNPILENRPPTATVDSNKDNNGSPSEEEVLFTKNKIPRNKNPTERKANIKGIVKRLKTISEKNIWPGDCDILIIGGGAIGSSIAYHLKKNGTDGIRVVVVEKDSMYKESSTVLSVGGIRHQFSLPENILLSMYGMEFIRDIPRLLEINGEPPPCVNFQPHGYLTLATENGLQQLKDNLYVQQHFKAQVKFLDPSELAASYPWMSTSGIAGGVVGERGEGWFDPWSLLQGLRRKATHLGAEYIEGEMVAAAFSPMSNQQFVMAQPCSSEQKINSVDIKLPDGSVKTIRPAVLMLATGHTTGQICYDMLGIGQAKEGLMAYPVPIEPRKRYVYSFHAPKGPGDPTPLVIDPSGAYFRREGLGNMYIGGMSPSEDKEPLCDNLDVDHDYFLEHVWPALCNRVPAFEELKLQGSWAGFYEHNVFDQNGILGTHPLVGNLMLAAGFSGHGIQHSLGVGRAVMELTLSGNYKTLDLSRFQPERIPLNEPVYETGIV